MTDLMQLDLRKRLILDLKKAKGLDGQKAAVVACYDYSGSMEWLYKNGFVQRLTERILPLGLGFDDNGEVDLFVFHSQAFRHPNNITLKNVDSIVGEIQKKYSYGGTNYAPTIELILNEWAEKTGGGLFSKSGRKPKKLDYPVYVLYITDGDNSDPMETEKLIREASNYGIFFQFIGIGNASFSFLKKLDDLSGRLIDNANFAQFNDLDKVSDEELYSRLMEEFPSWIQGARRNNLIG